ncbi:uncharacterized protein [Nicotiana tomentosiformis]|uniref:uncharacterized protein n=1 Tax=Nicotiana tomentosiformis TaxID=4098 RepID=UPI00388CC6DA
MAREVEMGNSYELVVEIAGRIEGVHQGSREQVMRDKRLDILESSEVLRLGAEGSSSGYSGHQGLTSSQQAIAPRSCYECGAFSHMQRFFPKLWDRQVQHGQQPMITAPVAPSVVRPPIGGGQVGKGHPRGRGKPGGAPPRFYAFPSRSDVEASYVVITVIISIYGKDASVLFDPGSTYSYVSSLFSHFLDVSRDSLGTHVYVSTPVGDYVVVDQIYQSYIMTFWGYETREDLLLLEMTDFEIILGMDWLSQYHAILDFHAMTVTLAIPVLPRLEWKGSSVSASNRVIVFLKARHMVKKGCLSYLAYVRDTTTDTPAIDSVPVVREFSDVFPSDLSSIPPDRDIDLCIDLALDTQPISIPPYRMAPK